MLRFGGFLGRSFLHTLCAPKVTFKAEAGVGAKVGAEAEYDLADLKDRILAEYRHVAHPEKEFLNEFEAALSSWVHDTIGEDKERMVVFIDDLDRCLPEVALEVLAAVKLYLNIEGIVFVVGVDRMVIDHLVARRYKRLDLSEDTSERYLDKMFQVEVHLSPRDTQIEAFLQSLLAEEQVGIKDVEGKEHEILCKVILKLARQNPRETKRLLGSALMDSLGGSIGAAARGANEPRLRTAQAIQYSLVRKIMSSHNLENLLAQRRTREFFYEWSKIVNERKDVEECETALRGLCDKFSDLGPAALRTLMTNENLRELMVIPFPGPDELEAAIFHVSVEDKMCVSMTATASTVRRNHGHGAHQGPVSQPSPSTE